MTLHKKAAECRDTQTAVKASHIQDHSNCKRPASTFIPIDAHYAIGADAHSRHILQRRRYKDGYKWEPILWFGTREQCVHSLWQRAVQTCGAQSLAELVAESQRIISAICQALRPSLKVQVCRDA
ncbi:MAG TPA: hypothetical protein VHJ19_01975 [Gammaproteobacteria bacterium]|nr:hypothetical protein [Gammaproteobacteria bacterium]